ncbi:farnesyl pyrophosphate synthase [Penicillium macrosclerotiorum]|uniref:farnesyl pyrophosphate synthase n=1 Tax=Penicillium macrosclerotiorum TaxID=303699 RepID=UPI0025465B8C|nr:farnesyl pyrophosphate synthase [Penicillium macrosclerotiorum]KAJ5688666.1 farnesyl pyrophosphate synthase [Penicillium macrosclerotiorum]
MTSINNYFLRGLFNEDSPTTMSQNIQQTNFKALLPSIIKGHLDYTKEYNIPKDIMDRLEECLTYNVSGGKLNRGLSVPDTGRYLIGRLLNEDEFRALATLGWLTELLQAFLLVHDDIMDKSLTRRGQACWYRRSDIGLAAVNDAVILESLIYVTLKSEFREHPSYIQLMELFHEAALQTELGQLCDMMTALDDNVDLSRFSIERYSLIVRHKTSYYSFYLPVTLALHWLELATPRNLDQVYKIMMPMGEYFQAQDDYLDVFGDSTVTGKVGTDIQDNKCSWVINEALIRCTPCQRRILDESYGRKGKIYEDRVYTVFCELGMKKIYQEFEEQRIQELRQMISLIDESEGLRKDVFTTFLSKISNRSS